MLRIFNNTDSFDRLARELDRALERAIAGGLPRMQGLEPAAAMLSPVAPLASGGRVWPCMNVWRDGEHIVAEAEIPGFRIEDIEVLATEESLTIRGERTIGEPENATALRIERSTKRFERSVRLPIRIAPDDVRATLSNGVLRVMMPVEESARPRRVSIQAEPEALLRGSSCEALPAGSSKRASGA